LFTPLAFLTYLARTAENLSFLPKGSLLHSALVQVPILGPQSKGTKNPETDLAAARDRAQELMFRFSACLGSSILAPFPSRRRSRLLRRCSCSATSTIRHSMLCNNSGRTQAGFQPSGVGRLNVRLACVERATTMRTGSVWLAFSSTWTTCGGTQTKSPACAV
jgi:hypothetical protein